MVTTKSRGGKRATINRLEDMMNVGPSIANDLRAIGIRRPSDLAGKDPLVLYQELCDVSGTRQDPCVLDTFIAIVRFADGGPQRPWWKYTAERKKKHAGI